MATAARTDPAEPLPVGELPVAPDQYPEVVNAAEVLNRAIAERAKALADLTAALERLDGYRADGAKRMLAELGATAAASLGEFSAGVERPNAVVSAAGVDAEEARLAAAVDEAKRRHQTATAAVDLAGARHDAALREARAEFATRLRPTLVEAVKHVAKLLRVAARANEGLLALAEFGHEHDPTAPWSYEVAFKLPKADEVFNLAAAREVMLAVHEPPKDRVRVRFTIVHMPFNAGEQAGLTESEAQLLVRAGVAELVDPGEAKRLKLDKLVKFSKPTKLKMSKPFTLREGSTIPANTKHTFEPEVASRIVNLGFGGVADG